jgi:hypothetical protein
MYKHNNKANILIKIIVNMKMAVFWVVAPCSLVEVYQRCRGPCCLHQDIHEDLGNDKDNDAHVNIT